MVEYCSFAQLRYLFISVNFQTVISLIAEIALQLFNFPFQIDDLLFRSFELLTEEVSLFREFLLQICLNV